jgi:hypothetical protein
VYCHAWLQPSNSYHTLKRSFCSPPLAGGFVSSSLSPALKATTRNESIFLKQRGPMTVYSVFHMGVPRKKGLKMFLSGGELI